jgi:Flp pilus assembly protein TadG
MRMGNGGEIAASRVGPALTKARQVGARGARGQALIEVALTLPLLLLLVFGVIQCGTLFNHWVVLTEAVRAGARELSLGRSPNVNACQNATARVKTAAFNLNPANVAVSYTVTNSCTDLVAGSDATLTATYPCDLTIMGISYITNCTLRSQTTERVE